jgi:hypothetical protein
MKINELAVFSYIELLNCYQRCRHAHNVLGESHILLTHLYVAYVMKFNWSSYFM